MPYIGNTPAEKYAAFDVQYFTTSATTSYTLDHAVANELDIRLVINNVIQEPGSDKAYTASGTTLTLSGATAGTDTMYCVYTAKAVQTVNPSAGSVGTSQLADDAVTTIKINDDAVNSDKLSSTAVDNTNTNSTLITAQTEKTSLVDADKFLISDSAASGAFKYVQKSNLPSGGLVYTGGGATTTNVSAIAINGCFSATYRQYLVVYDITPDTNGSNPRINFRDTSNNNITPSKYGYAFLGRDFGGGDENFQQDNDESALQPGQGTYNQSNSDYPTLSGYLWIINPFSATHNVNWHGQVMNRGNNGEDRVYVGSGRLDVQTQCAGLKFFFNSGNVNNATIKVYGLVDS